MSAIERFVSSSAGDDLGPGTFANPFRTVARGLQGLNPGDTLSLREGVYLEPVTIDGLNGTAKQRIVIRAVPGERAVIDATVAQFRQAGNADWLPASGEGAHPDEFVSVPTFPAAGKENVNRGAFLDGQRYARLLTYSRLQDLRANNERFGRVASSDPDVGPLERGQPGLRRLWTYMGPGMFYDDQTGKVHIRLSHTTHGIDGFPDYQGETDPTRLALAISRTDMTTLTVARSSFLTFQGLTFRFGGETTIQTHHVDGLVFDHVSVLCATHGARLEERSDHTTLAHCVFDGGLPPWFFRSDRKSEFVILNEDGSFDPTNQNNLAGQTSVALLFGNPNSSGTQIHHCEFVNGHDLKLFGRRVQFHHNWLHNIQDEALILDAAQTDDVHVHQNVMTKCLSAISFANDKIGSKRFICRNLIDLRRPIAFRRPAHPDDQSEGGPFKVVEHGHLYKSNPPDGPVDFFHNTFLVLGQDNQAAYQHYTGLKSAGVRRSFNNIFIAVNPDEASDIALAFLPPPTFQGPTDGNCYFRIGMKSAPLLRLQVEEGETQTGKRCVESLQQLRQDTDTGHCRPRGYFALSQALYPPGFEANGIDADPMFRFIRADGIASPEDDLRLKNGSPAVGAGVPLVPDLKAKDPLASDAPKPDIGCYPLGAAPLKVGVDGRRRATDAL
jgi:hypothetical protein